MSNESQLYYDWTAGVCWKIILRDQQISRQKSDSRPTNFRCIFARTNIQETNKE